MLTQCSILPQDLPTIAFLWPTYFEEPYKNHKALKYLKSIKTIFTPQTTLFFKKQVEDAVVKLNYIELCSKFSHFEWFQSTLNKMPSIILNLIAITLHEQHLLSFDPVQLCEENTSKYKRITLRLTHYTEFTSLANLKSNTIGSLVTIKGTIVRASSIRPLVTQIEFECSLCKKIQIVRLIDNKFKAPKACATTQCKSRSIVAKKKIGTLTQCVDSQTLRLQEKLIDDYSDLGRVPRLIDCELTNDMVDICKPGDVVCVTGIVKLRNSEDSSRSKQKSSMYTLHIEALYLCKGDSVDAENKEEPYKGIMQYTNKDYEFIGMLFKQKNIFKLIVNSLSPSIFGHELVKAGIILTLFGGRRRENSERDLFSVRGDSHILIVGDPGLGKSQMLSAAISIAPRGVYVCASSGISSSGLTVTLTKESGSNEFALEAGALVLADQGCCCIDEFDKMGAEHSALFEAMEQQNISIAKAGVVCNLPARTSILAAANPVNGHYNKSKTVSENLKMGSALLSRFDLIFILLDQSDEKFDEQLAQHVMSIHSGNKRSFEYIDSQELPSSDTTLLSRLKLKSSSEMDPIPPSLLRKYIAYARTYIKPNLSVEAGKEIKEFYLSLRDKYKSTDTAPITTRQLESMVRLAEARAKVELREVVTKQDARDVIELIKYTLFKTYEDDLGNHDFQRSQNGTGSSRQSEIKKFIKELEKIAQETFNKRFTYQTLYNIGKQIKINTQDFRDFVDALNLQNYLLKKGSNVYELSTI